MVLDLILMLSKMQILAKLEDELKKIDTNYIGCEILSKIYKNL